MHKMCCDIWCVQCVTQPTVSSRILQTVLTGSVSSSPTLENVCQFTSVVSPRKYTRTRTHLFHVLHTCAFNLAVCKKDLCPTTTKPSCPAYKRLSVKQTECCDSYQCVCDCQNVTRTCPPGYITKTTANDCDCVEVTCAPDKVGVFIYSLLLCVLFTWPWQLLQYVLMTVHPISMRSTIFISKRALFVCRCVWWTPWCIRWAAGGKRSAKLVPARNRRTDRRGCTSLSVWTPSATRFVLW